MSCLTTSHLFLLLASTLTSQLHIEKSILVKEKSSDFWNSIVNRTFNQIDWYENFRMIKETFKYLRNELKVYIEKKDIRLRQAIPVKLRLPITVWFLSTGTEYNILGHLFGVSRSSICCIINQVCITIENVLIHCCIKFPVGDVLQALVDGFHDQWGFPNC